MPFKGKDYVPNSWGLYEMMDDIGEICVDGHFSTYAEQFGGKVGIDPIGNPKSEYRNVRNWSSVHVNLIGQRMYIPNDDLKYGIIGVLGPFSCRIGYFPVD